MRSQFVLSEMAVGLRRNLTMLIAVVLTVAISLGLLGAGWLIHRQIDGLKTFWFGKIEVSVFLNKDVTPDQRATIQSQLQGLPEVKRVYYESKQEAWQHFKQDFKDSPALVKNASPDALPESFRVKLKDPRKYAIVQSAIQGQPGVEEVQDQGRLLKKFFGMMNGLQLFAWVVAAAALAAAVLLVYNTIRVAAFSRRRETGIMRLVGASNFYIQLPFVLEGALAGLIGAVFAVGGLVAIKLLVFNQLHNAFRALFSGRFIGWHDVLVTAPFLALIGVALAAAASFVTLRRYLRV